MTEANAKYSVTVSSLSVFTRKSLKAQHSKFFQHVGSFLLGLKLN